MKTFLSLLSIAGLAAVTSPVVWGQSATVRGGSVTGGSATGGSVTGGSATGGSVTGGTVTGGSATGGSVTGGSVTGGSVTDGTATAGTVSPGTATATVNGREIRVTAPGTVSVNVNGDSANVAVGGQSLTVGENKLKLDGKDLGDIPPETKKLEVTVKNDTLVVKGDGKEIARGKLGRE